jgi:hypothetical protein
LTAGPNLKNCKFTGDRTECAGIAGDSHVKLKNIWREFLIQESLASLYEIDFIA